MIGRPILTQQQLEAHRTTVQGQDDVVWNPLYDYQTYTASTGHTQLTFFALQIGQGTTSAAGATGPKTEADTNMTNSGLLPTGNEFFCTGVEIEFIPGVQPGLGSVALADFADAYVNDVYTIAKSGFLKFTIQQRDYILDGPLQLFPSTTRLVLATSLAATFDADQATGVIEQVSYANFSGEPYQITPVYIVDNQAFKVTLNWPAAQVLPSAVNARIGVRLNGNLIRSAQ